MAPQKDSRTSDRDRKAQHAYFSGEASGVTTDPLAKKPLLFLPPISPAVGVAAGLSVAVLVVITLALVPMRRRDPALLPLPVATPTRLVSRRMFVLTSTTKRLKDIPEGVLFRADISTISALREALYSEYGRKPATPADQDRILLETAPPAEEAPFYLLKQDGKFYLCAYTYGRVPDVMLKAATEHWVALFSNGTSIRGKASASGQLQSVALFSSAAAAQDRTTLRQPVSEGEVYGDNLKDGELTQIRVPLDGLGMGGFSSTSDGKGMMSTEVMHLDAHAYEHWIALPLSQQSSRGEISPSPEP